MPVYLSYDEVDVLVSNDVDGIFAMSPPFIGEDECLVPGEPVVQVERAPQNSRRIFVGIDIPSASVNEVPVAPVVGVGLEGTVKVHLPPSVRIVSLCWFY